MEESKVKYMGLDLSPEMTFEKDFGRKGKFKLRVALPYQKIHIISNTNSQCNGKSPEQVGVEFYEYVRMVITLNTVLTATPEWWEGAEKCPDDDFLKELWRYYLNCETDFADRLKSKIKSTTMEKT